MSQETRPLEGLWPCQSASIEHDRRFRCANGAMWSVSFHQTGITGVSGFWSTLGAKVLLEGVVFAAQQSPDLTSLCTRAFATVLVVTIGIAVCDVDGSAEDIIY